MDEGDRNGTDRFPGTYYEKEEQEANGGGGLGSIGASGKVSEIKEPQNAIDPVLTYKAFLRVRRLSSIEYPNVMVRDPTFIAKLLLARIGIHFLVYLRERMDRSILSFELETNLHRLYSHFKCQTQRKERRVGRGPQKKEKKTQMM